MKNDPLNFWSGMAEAGKKTLGRPKAIESPELLWKLACEYFQSINDEPWVKNELIKGGDLAGCVVAVKYQKPYTWQGLENYLFYNGVISDLRDYRANTANAYADFQHTIKIIKNIMFQQKFEGASVGAFNSSIIATELGLISRTAVETTDTTDKFDYSDLSDSALEEIAAARKKAKENGE